MVPKETFFDENSAHKMTIDMASIYLHFLFNDNDQNTNTARRVMAGLICISIFGNVVVMTFTAGRVKQEIAKEGILPYLLFFATGHTTPWAWFMSKDQDTAQSVPVPEAGWAGSPGRFERRSRKVPQSSPYAALGIFSVLDSGDVEPEAGDGICHSDLALRVRKLHHLWCAGRWRSSVSEIRLVVPGRWSKVARKCGVLAVV